MRVLGATFLTLLVLATTAQAGTLTTTLDLSTRGPETVWWMVYEYDAAPGERNNLVITHNPSSPLRETFTDFGAPLILGPNPIAFWPLPIVGIAVGPASICVPGLLIVTCTNFTGDAQFAARLGDGNDRARLDGPEFGTIDGGPGDDIVGGGSGNEDVLPGPGADTVYGGVGNDRITLFPDGAADNVSCGQGNDTVVRSAPDPLDTIAPDCEVVS